MSARDRMGPSESQTRANALALENRGRTYADRNAASFRFSWDAGKRGPRDLRHAVELVRRAYRDEVPTKLHEGPDSIGEGGTPKFAAMFLGYLDSPTMTDAGHPPKCECATEWKEAWIAGGHGLHADTCPADPARRNLIAYRLTPFRATLSDMEKAREEATRRRAAIVSHVAFGMDPVEAATSEGCHPLDAKLVVFDALCSFLRRLTDVRVDVPGGTVAA